MGIDSIYFVAGVETGATGVAFAVGPVPGGAVTRDGMEIVIGIGRTLI
jgi:hypothetical protein